MSVRRPRTRGRADEGSALIEFIFGSVVLLIPLLYLIVALAQVQAGAYAAQSTAIDAAHSAARHPSASQNTARDIGALHFADHGLEHADWQIDLSCAGNCSTAGTPVTATVVARIPVPGIPAVLGETRLPAITVRSAHTDLVAPAEG
ncbi:TadE/TadG family type IV pilus assembly protein [Brevibacterium jeotgali]|uniref:TadE-like protein n=1 Tax=Brevibacterium jeotgali TaxID=1262550 RepID=A0A2H1L5R9_9MICO|nr:hypothetical protein [Brevibacterium jeotgali]TWB98950.1 hypothetical protein FB108_2849 [Brevibacterium jeotgali]SMY12219.1 hypothetical protein BJEO58_01813 [Brevibacterium jeotgali]